MFVVKSHDDNENRSQLYINENDYQLLLEISL
jgi:hypothetical protein